MAPRQDVSEKRRAEIVDAAARVFSRKGFSGARMDDIVQETGLSKGLLYWYFKGKDAIIVAIMERLFRPEAARVRSLAATTGSARQRLIGLGESVVREVELMERFMPITFEFYSLAFRNRAVKKFFQDFFRIFVEGIQKVIEQGIEGGEFRRVDPREIAVAMTASFEGALLLWVFDPGTVDREAQTRLAVELILRGIERVDPAGASRSTRGREDRGEDRS
jgi:AcrR family transcriptional regulator